MGSSDKPDVTAAHNFAQYAEAVGVPTVQVLSVMIDPPRGVFFIVYSPDAACERCVTVGLTHDADGIIRTIGPTMDVTDEFRSSRMGLE